jgi:antirestriction protein ArdC
MKMSKVHEIITEKIIEELEKGSIPWQKPWTGMGKCINYKSRKSYSLLNEFLLGQPGEYLTFKQVEEAGGKVKKGEKAKSVTFWKILVVEDKNAKGETVKKKIPLLRYYNVFNLSQTEGIESKITEVEKEFKDCEVVEKVVHDYYSKQGIKFSNAISNEAYYAPSLDSIVMPQKKQFHNENLYYTVLFHETVHSTGHPKRLKRIKDMTFFGSEAYSKEELVAEIGAATLMNMFNIDTEGTFQNSAAYIQSWIRALKDDKNLIISASTKANQAVKFILDEDMEEEFDSLSPATQGGREFREEVI